MAQYLVTGAAGFIGANIAQRLLNLGHKVTTIDNLSSGYKSCIPKQCEFIKGDISDKKSIEHLNNKFFDAILHIAGQSSGEISFEDPVYDINSNAVSTLRLLDYAVKTGCQRFIYASSMSVYGQQGRKEQFSEQDILQPKSFYAVGKLASEHYLRIYEEQFGIDYTVLRYFNVYGAGQNLANLKQGMVSIYLKQFIDDAFKKVEVKGSTDRFRDLSYVDDVAEVSIESINNQKFFNEIINIGTGKKTNIKTMLSLMKKYLSSNKDIIISEGTLGDQFGIYADTSKLKAIYPKNFMSFESGLKRMIADINCEI
jgi:UDP-glucose 4-epimerase